MTNTNWQAYSGEATMSYFTQMAGLGRAQFRQRRDRHRRRRGARPRTVAQTSADTSETSGPTSPAARSTSCCRSRWSSRSCSCSRAWCKLSRLMRPRPRSKARRKQIPLGPAASQIAIKQLGTNGGGFFGAEQRASLRESDAAFELPRDASRSLRSPRRWFTCSA